MENNKLTIIPPKGMEAYQEGNEIKFRPIQKKVTYNDVAEILFKENAVYITSYGDIAVDINPRKVEEGIYTTSKKQAEKLSAINKLLNVAKYLNGDWKPDWNNCNECKYYIRIDAYNEVQTGYANSTCSDIAYFKTIELAKQAIEILGEEIIRLALSTDW